MGNIEDIRNVKVSLNKKTRKMTVEFEAVLAVMLKVPATQIKAETMQRINDGLQIALLKGEL